MTDGPDRATLVTKLREFDAVSHAVLVGDEPESHVELTISGGEIPPGVLVALGEWGLSINPDRTATRGGTVLTVVVAE